MKKKSDAPTVEFALGPIIKDMGIYYREAGRRTGLSVTAISVLAGEPEQVQIKTIEKLCRGLNVKPCDLFRVVE